MRIKGDNVSESVLMKLSALCGRYYYHLYLMIPVLVFSPCTLAHI